MKYFSRLVLVYIGIVICLYPLGVWLLIRIQSASALTFTVGISAIVACLICRRDIGSLGWKWSSSRYLWISYLIPLLYCFIAYFTIWLFNLGRWYDHAFVDALRTGYRLQHWSDSLVIAFRFIITSTVSFALLLLGVLAEETGWRGIAQYYVLSKTQMSMVLESIKE